MKHTKLVFQFVKIDSTFCTNAAVTHRKQRCGNKNTSNSAIVYVCGKCGNVLNNTPPDGDDHGLTVTFVFFKKTKGSCDPFQCLFVFCCFYNKGWRCAG